MRCLAVERLVRTRFGVPIDVRGQVLPEVRAPERHEDAAGMLVLERADEALNDGDGAVPV